jgi:uncharacterized protein (TIGR02145 family)
MKFFTTWGVAALLAASIGALSSCQNTLPTPANPPAGGGTGNDPTPTTPATSIPDALVGTWYAENNPSPLTTNWNQGTFQGTVGFAEYRTLVLTKDGTNAVDYTSEAYSTGEQRMFKMTGTLEYNASINRLTFHAQSGTVRVYSAGSTTYQESPIVATDVAKYKMTWSQPMATTFTDRPNVLVADRMSGAQAIASKYKQVAGTGRPDPNPSNGLYDNPPATGTYIKIGNQYFPTATIGKQVWMSVNYVGNGGIADAQHPEYGTYYRFFDLKNVQIPAGWRIPTQQDYEDLLASQGLALNMWGSTDPSDLASKRKLGQLMAPGVWRKQDGYATNSSGFGAVPSDYRNTNVVGNGLGSNCRLWTAEKDSDDHPLAFQIIQIVSDTYSSLLSFPITSIETYMPVRLVRDK